MPYLLRRVFVTSHSLLVARFEQPGIPECFNSLLVMRGVVLAGRDCRGAEAAFNDYHPTPDMPPGVGWKISRYQTRNYRR